MSQLFDFQDVSKCEETIRKTWEELRSALANGDVRFDNVNEALRYTFLKVFDDMYSHMGDKMQLKLSEMKEKVLLRGTIIRSGECPDYKRMIPDANYITDDNRFSPPGIEWLYLSFDNEFNHVLSCSKAECRVKEDDRFAYCRFEIDDCFSEVKLIDLTLADGLSTQEINNSLEQKAQEYKKRLWNRSQRMKSFVYPTPADEDQIKTEIGTWVFRTYLKLLSSQIFTPLSGTDDKRLMYTPFHCMAQYFISKGFEGIIYKSTVSLKGKNIVLFDKNYAKPAGDIIIVEPE